MILRKGFRFRLYPTGEQDRLFRRTAGCCRAVHNAALDQRKLEWHRSQPRRISAIDQINELKALKADFVWLKEVPHHPLQQKLRDLQKAYINFWEGRAAYPKFEKKGEGDSFRFPDPKHVTIEAGRIFLPKARWVEMVAHREIVGTPKNFTVSREGDAWYVSIQTEIEVPDPVPADGPSVGIDLGIAQPVVLSDGRKFDLPKVSGKERKQLAAAQKTHARRKKGSKNRDKARRRIARLQAKFARRRRDAAHKLTTHLVKTHGLIVVEDLKVKNMTASAAGTAEAPGRNVRQKAGLNRAMLDVSFGQIRTMLEYKAAWRGVTVVAVPPHHTSQTCSACKKVDAKSRVSRDWFACTGCGMEMDADVNAAINVLERGIEVLATGGAPGVACESSSGRLPEAGSSSREGEARHFRAE